MLLFGFPSSKELGEFAMNCLAVAGGFVVGYIVGAIGAWALDNWAFDKKSPAMLKKAIRVLAGIALALLIAFLVFRGGSGGGWGGGNGPEGPGSNGSPNPDNGAKTEPNKDVKTPKIDTPKTPELSPDDPKIRVTFLGGDAVQGDRFYRIDDDDVPKSFAELKTIVQKRKEFSTRPLILIVQFPSDPKQRIDPSSINVTQVTAWAEANGIGIYKPGK